jgi:hypothetical protein
MTVNHIDDLKGAPWESQAGAVGIIPFLSLMTLLAVAIFVLVSKERVERRHKDPDTSKSTLAKDAPDS